MFFLYEFWHFFMFFIGFLTCINCERCILFSWEVWWLMWTIVAIVEVMSRLEKNLRWIMCDRIMPCEVLGFCGWIALFHSCFFMWCLSLNTNPYTFRKVECCSLRDFYHHGTFLILTWLLVHFAFCDHVFMHSLLPWYHSSIFHLSHFFSLLGFLEKYVCLVHSFLLVVVLL